MYRPRSLRLISVSTWLVSALCAPSFAQTVSCQLPNQQANGGVQAIAATSDQNPVSYGTAIEAIEGAASPVSLTGVRWWGIYLDNTSFGPCGPPASDDFSITYFNEVSGFPSTLHAGPFPLTPSRTATGLSISWPAGDPDEYEYFATHPPVTLSTDRLWISIHNNTTGNCVWRWSSSPTGDGLCVIDAAAGGFEISAVDLAYCVETGVTEPGSAYCDCTSGAPCSNPGVLNSGCRNSSGSGASLTASGDANVLADSVVLHVDHGPATTPGLFFSGPVALTPTPFNDGLRCVGGSILRLQVALTDASGQASSSVTLSAVEGLAGGETRHYQYWYRDVSGPCGGGSNTTNGYRITW